MNKPTAVPGTTRLPPAEVEWHVDPAESHAALCLRGEWTVHGLAKPPALHAPQGCRAIRIEAPSDVSALAVDSAGACVLAEAMRAWTDAGIDVDIAALPQAAQGLVELVRTRGARPPAEPVVPHAGIVGDIGRGTVAALREGGAFLGALGELVLRGGVLVIRPDRIRWRAVVAEIDAAGLHATGIVALLSFLIGMVMAYQGGATLATYGANILIVNLVSILTLREMGPLLTAILVAGRTGSSYTAQIGTMRITEEVDALRALGLSPFEVLVFPKVVALALVMPLLSLLADLMGLLGGAVVASVGYGVPMQTYFSRVPQIVNVGTLMLGLGKAPVFAVVVALVGCMQGMRVAGSAAAVGRATTRSVVQSIFLVIIIDAAFSIIYNVLGL